MTHARNLLENANAADDYGARSAFRQRGRACRGPSGPCEYDRYASAQQFDMRNVVAYCRSACEPQRGPFAVHRQARVIRQHAKGMGLAIRSIYMDPGVSGSSLDLPAVGLQQPGMAGAPVQDVQRPPSDQAMAAKLIRALLAGRVAGDIIVLQDE